MHTAELEANPGTILTLRQVQVLFYLALGKTLEEIAIILGVSRTTAKAHAELLYAKLHAENRAQLITHAFLRGFLTAGKAATAMLLVVVSLSNGMASDTSLNDQARNFRQQRTRRQRDTLNLPTLDFDYA